MTSSKIVCKKIACEQFVKNTKKRCKKRIKKMNHEIEV
jgi:hypothetical protein